MQRASQDLWTPVRKMRYPQLFAQPVGVALSNLANGLDIVIVPIHLMIYTLRRVRINHTYNTASHYLRIHIWQTSLKVLLYQIAPSVDVGLHLTAIAIIQLCLFYTVFDDRPIKPLFFIALFVNQPAQRLREVLSISGVPRPALRRKTMICQPGCVLIKPTPTL